MIRRMIYHTASDGVLTVSGYRSDSKNRSVYFYNESLVLPAARDLRLARFLYVGACEILQIFHFIQIISVFIGG